MKLLSIASSSYKGGATISLLNTLIGLKAKGLDIRVIVPDKGFLTDELDKKRIPYYLASAPFWIKPPLNSLRDHLLYVPKVIRTISKERVANRKILNYISKWQPDIIHTNVSVIKTGYNISKKIKVPHVWHIREYGDLDFNYHSLDGKKRLREILNDSYCICITKGLKRYFNLGVKAQVIYNGIEERKIKSIKDTKENKIIFVGRLTKEKGIFDILDAFKKFYLKCKNYKLELIGGYTEDVYKELTQRISTLELNDSIIIRGHLTNVYPHMQTAKAIIVASYNEGFGRITAEAMLNNCLVIGLDNAGTKEQFDNGYKYFHKEIGIRYGGKKKLEEALYEMSSLKRENYEEIVRNAKEVVKEFYSVEKNVDEVLEFLKNIYQNS